MAVFSIAYKRTVLGVEGGYANSKLDHGGETYRGCSRNNFPNESIWSIVDAAKSQPNFPHNLASIPELETAIQKFYLVNFWDNIRLGEITNQDIANEAFDIGVNSGTGYASKLLQQSVNLCNYQTNIGKLVVDGGVGSKTIAAVNGLPYQKALLKTLNGLQFAHYAGIVTANPSQLVWFRGWLTRVWEA